tara:strand:+ start:320 stop:559 length:240 start_codon:yes stop_codon:yes gene_type:complete
MKTLVLLSVVGVLSACSSGMPNTEVIAEKKIYSMTRGEVINGIEDCKAVDLRPVLIHTRRKINNRPVPVVIDVSCAPRG